MSAFLLDANALIALVVREHVHHDLVLDWFARVEGVLLCPVVEGALVRFLVRAGESARTAQQLLGALSEHPRVETCPDSVSYTNVPLDKVRGHRQVTDAYLVALATSRNARVATLDHGLVTVHGDGALLIAASRQMS